MTTALCRCSRSELELLFILKVKHRWDWPGCFSTNWYGELWPWVVFNRTPTLQRVNVAGVSTLLDELAGRFLEVRPEGGRFFVNNEGAFWKPGLLEVKEFARLEIVEGPAPRRKVRAAPTHETTYMRDRRHHAEGHCDRASCRWCSDEDAKAIAEKKSAELKREADVLLGEDRKRYVPRWKR